MSTEKILDKLAILKNKIIDTEGKVDIDVIKEISRILRSEKNKDELRDFYFELRKFLFDNNISVPSFNNLDIFFNAQLKKEKTKKDILKHKSEQEEKFIGFCDFFKGITKAIYPIYSSLKNCYILNLNNDLQSYKLIILHDQGCFFQHLREEINTKDIECECSEYDDFCKKIENGNIKSNYLCILLISPKVSRKELDDEIVPAIDKIVSLFDESEYISILSDNFETKKWYLKHNDISELKNDIKCVGISTLANGELSNDEEKIIKKCFGYSDTELLEYRMIKSGHSGSKVIETKPRSIFGNGNTKTYILKINDATRDSKLKKEVENFRRYIEPYYKSENVYQQDYQKSFTHEAIKYTYASPNNTVVMHSLASILDDITARGRTKGILIKNIFSVVSLFKIWEDSKKSEEMTIAEHYEGYLNIEKIKEAILKIEGCSNYKIENNELYNNLNIILNKNKKFGRKVCHGDLHTENIFVSENFQSVYLIDFGLTNYYQSCFDYATLECSIRYKHIPRYIKIKDLQKIEDNALKNTFQPSTSLSTYTERDDLKFYLDIIHDIRKEAFNEIDDKINFLDYYIALFIVSCRQLCYSDLNQLYIYQTAKTVSNHIIKNI